MVKILGYFRWQLERWQVHAILTPDHILAFDPKRRNTLDLRGDGHDAL